MIARDRLRLPVQFVLFKARDNEVAEEDVEGFSSISRLRELPSLRQLRRRRRNGVLMVVVVVLLILTLGQRANLIGCSAFDVNGMIGFLNGRRYRRISSV